MATAFVPVIGYDKAAALAVEAYEKNKTVREVALEKQVLPEEEIQKILNRLMGKDEMR